MSKKFAYQMFAGLIDLPEAPKRLEVKSDEEETHFVAVVDDEYEGDSDRTAADYADAPPLAEIYE